MKKLLMNLADSLLSREQMKSVKGGYGAEGDRCSTKCTYYVASTNRYETEYCYENRGQCKCISSPGATCS